MHKPRLVLETDDNKSMCSELHIVPTKNDRIDFTHVTQGGKEELIQIFPNQVEKLVKFLEQSKIWIESGYREELKPESSSEC